MDQQSAFVPLCHVQFVAFGDARSAWGGGGSQGFARESPGGLLVETVTWVSGFGSYSFMVDFSHNNFGISFGPAKSDKLCRGGPDSNTRPLPDAQRGVWPLLPGVLAEAVGHRGGSARNSWEDKSPAIRFLRICFSFFVSAFGWFLGPPVVPLSTLFFGEGSPTK